jgi:hypothetical protein
MRLGFGNRAGIVAGMLKTWRLICNGNGQGLTAEVQRYRPSADMVVIWFSGELASLKAAPADTFYPILTHCGDLITASKGEIHD